MRVRVPGVIAVFFVSTKFWGYTYNMGKHLHLVLEEAEFAAIREAAFEHRMTVEEWVRHALAEARREKPAAIFPDMLRAIHDAIRHEFPSMEIDQMLLEIERGYLPGEP